MLMADSDETLDESSSSSPIASIGAQAVQSLALSSPNRDDDDDQVSVSVSPGNKTQIESAPINLEQGECKNLFRFANMSQGRDEFNDSMFGFYNYPESRRWMSPIDSPGYDSDDDEWRYQQQRFSRYQRFWRFNQETINFFEPSDVGAGLMNLGNSCFVNSVMQCFTHTVPLIESLLSYQFQHPCNCGNEVFCVIRSLRCHIFNALMTSRCSISLSHILNNLQYFSPDFRRYQQEDAHEFLQAFLDKLERCSVDRSGDDISSQEDNIVQRDFGGRLVSRLRCCNCNSVSETFENSFGLSLEIEDVGNLSSALESFTSEEKLEDRMTCDDCKEKVLKEKQLLLDKLPVVATFHLKRFKNNGYYMEKIFKHVEFPLELDLQPYMSHSENNQVETKYQLYAFVEHLGSLAYGHYCSYVRSSPKTWHKFDDQKVMRIKEDSVLLSDSYILFYAREGTPWFSRAFEEMQPLLEASLHNSLPKCVLDPSNGECSSEITDDNVDKSNKHVKTEENCVSLSNESNEDVFISAAESSGDDSLIEELLDPIFDTYAPCTEPELDSSLEIEKTITPVVMVQNPVSSPKQQERTLHIQVEHLESAKNQEEACKKALIGDYPNEFMSSSGESSGEDSSMSDLSGPLETDDSYGPCAEKEPDSVLVVQNQDSSLKQQEETFNVQIEHLETAKNLEEEEACNVADDMETEEVANGELEKKQSPRGRELYEVIAYTDSSPTKRIKTEVENENL